MLSFINKNIKYKFIIPSLLIILILAVAGVFVYKRNYFSKGPEKPVASPVKPDINFDPPTKEEKQAADDVKEQILQNQSQKEQSTSNGLKKVTPVITYASFGEVNSYVSGVVEEQGLCTAVFTQGGNTVTRTSQGFANASNTQCAPIIPGLPNREKWSVVVTYSSPSARGSSSPSEIKQ